MRLFVAVDVSAGAREAGRVAIDQLQLDPAVARASVRWLAPESWHLTLQFLGEVEEAQVPTIAAALGEVGGRNISRPDWRGVGPFRRGEPRA